MPRPLMAMEFQSDPSAVHYHVNPPSMVHASRCRSVNHIIVAGHSVMQSHHVGISRFADAQVPSSYCPESSQRFRAVAWTLVEPRLDLTPNGPAADCAVPVWEDSCDLR